MTSSTTDIHDTINQARELHKAGRLQEAEQLYRQVLTVAPENAGVIHLLGMIAFQTGKLDVASQLISHAIIKDSNQAAFHNNLGLVMQAQGQYERAVMLFKQAIDIAPRYEDAFCNLGITLENLGRLDEAIAAYDQAIALNPELANAHNSRGVTLYKLGRLEEGKRSLMLAVNIEPEFAEAYNNMGNILEAQGMSHEAQACYKRVLSLQPANARAFSNLLLCMNYDADVDAATLYQTHLAWDKNYAQPQVAGTRTFGNTRDPQRKLRIGYVSGDYYRHPVASFIEPILGTHDKQAFEIFCYANIIYRDGITQRLQGLCDHWRDILGMPDEHVANLIQQDGIDILVDLSGHSAGNRMPVFALKPAPIQVTYLGYPSTSGLSAMDFRITDEWLDPPGLPEDCHTEQLIRLARGSLCFRPPGLKPKTRENQDPDSITFASFNNMAKVTPEVIRVWSEILHRVPRSRLLLKSKSLGDPATVERLKTLFSGQNISEDRLVLVSWSASLEEHLALYEQVDIALDTFPYSGCTTTCEALWMGVPVITIASSESRNRMSTGVLMQAGLGELVTNSAETYIDLAQGLADHPDELEQLRARIHPAMAASTLLDPMTFTRSLEAAYREMWNNWCLQS